MSYTIHTTQSFNSRLKEILKKFPQSEAAVRDRMD